MEMRAQELKKMEEDLEKLVTQQTDKHEWAIQEIKDKQRELKEQKYGNFDKVRKMLAKLENVISVQIVDSPPSSLKLSRDSSRGQIS